MSKVSIEGNALGSGTFTIAAPNSNTSYTLTLPENTGTVITTASTFAGTGPAFSAFQSVAQTNLTTFVVVKVTFTTEEFDTNSNYDTSTSRFTPTVAGYYSVTACVTVASNASTSLALATIYKNGVAFKDGSASVGLNVLFPRSNAAALVYMNGTTDYLEVYVYGTNAGSDFTTSAANSNTYFQAALVRAA